MQARVIVLALIAGILAALTVAHASVDCEKVASNLRPCLDYLTGHSYGPNPPQACCDGVKYVKDMVRYPGDRRDACECLKRVAGPIRGLRDDLAKSLPEKCGVQFSVPISRNVDYSKI